MSKLFIVEFESLAKPLRDVDRTPAEAQVGQLPALAVQTLDIGGASVVSNAFNAKTRFIRLSADIACMIKVDTAPTATTSDVPLYANLPEYFGVSPGQKIAVIVAS